MKLEIGKNEYWIKDGVSLPSDFDSMDKYDKENYIYNNKLVHREDGPAVIYPSGIKEWWLNGLLHRLDGPAVIWSEGTKDWCLNNIWVDGRIYQKIQNLSKEDLLIYLVDPKYKYYLPLIEYRLGI